MGEFCRYCGKIVEPEEKVTTLSYWMSIPFTCHKRCKDQGEKEEAYECQLIDADCNNCKYFLRALASKWTCFGWCAKFTAMTIASPKFATNHKCFTHRKQPIELI